jgi:hypothetical protein
MEESEDFYRITVALVARVIKELDQTLIMVVTLEQLLQL